jgi:anti-sigma factor RsiW
MHPTDQRLNEYVDAALPESERRSVDEHVRGCERCRMLVTELRELDRATKSLQPMEPPDRVWVRLEQALSESASAQARATQSIGGRRQRWSLGWQPRTWAFAAAVMLVVTVAGLWVGLTGRRAASGPAASGEAPTAQSVEAELQQAEEHYQKAIKGLEQIANADKGALDPNTAATLQKNLSVVDQAISESRAALRAQPTSEPAQASLLESFKAKIGLLQETIALINEMRKGNEAGAAQIVSGLERGR